MNDLENLYADRRTIELQVIASERTYAAAVAAFDYDTEHIQLRFGPNYYQGIAGRDPVDRELLLRALRRLDDSERARHLAGEALTYDRKALDRFDKVIHELGLPK